HRRPGPRFTLKQKNLRVRERPWRGSGQGRDGRQSIQAGQAPVAAYGQERRGIATETGPGGRRTNADMMRIQGEAMTPRRVLAALALMAVTAAQAMANPRPWQLNMTPGVSDYSREVYDIHMLILWVCVVIGVLVFGAMGYAIFKFRKSKGAV